MQTTFFTPKDTLPTTNPAKTIYGAAYDVEFGNIATAINSKYDASSIASGAIGFALGSASTPSIYFGAVTNAGFYGDGSSGISIATANIQRLNVNSAGAVTISAPTAGNPALAVTGVAGSSTATFTNSTGSSVLNTAPSGYEAGYAVTVTSYAAGVFAINGGGSTDAFGIPNGAFGIGTSAAISLALATSATTRLTIASTGAINVVAPTSTASALTVNGITGASVLTIVSGSSSTTSFNDVNITRAGSTANQLQQGPSVQLFDSTNSTGSSLQHSGGQTEIWQYNGSTWRQAMLFGSYSSGFLLSFPNPQTSGSATAGGITVPATAAGFMIVSIGGSSRKIAYYAT